MAWLGSRRVSADYPDGALIQDAVGEVRRRSGELFALLADGPSPQVAVTRVAEHVDVSPVLAGIVLDQQVTTLLTAPHGDRPACHYPD